MTSSLVGSEMCIRDRFASKENYLLGGREMLYYHETLQRPAISWSVFLVPVSYTHLTLPTICSV
eukprot:8837449-Prorocentrum_lima.AAC.1